MKKILNHRRSSKWESNMELNPSGYLSIVAIIVQLNFKDSESIKLTVLKCVVKVSNWQCESVV